MRGLRLATALVIAAAAGAALVAARCRSSAGRARADLYFADGSMLSLGADAPEAEPLIAAARRAIGETA